MWAVLTSIVFLLLAVGTFWSWRTLVVSSGQPQWWLMFGAAPLATLLVTYIVAPYQHVASFGTSAVFNTPSRTTDYTMSDATSFLSTRHFLIAQFGALNTMVALDMVAVLAAWVAFVVFVLTKWSGAGAARAGVPGGVDMRRRLYCPWCGEHIPGNRALGHDCGPKDRPEVICRFCGQTFPEGTTSCPTCDA